MNPSSNNFFKKTTFTLLGIFLSLIFLEVFLRGFFYQNITPSLVAPAFGIPSAMRANFHSEGINPLGIKYTIQTNNRRLRREASIKYKKPPNTFRILCIGDSMTFGLSISNNETYSHYLEELLNKKTENVQFEVLNAGVTGWEPIDYYLYLKNEGIKYSPNLVIIGVDASDIVNLKSNFFEFGKLELKKSADSVNISLINPKVKPYFDKVMEAIREGILNLPFFLPISEVSQYLNLIRKNLSIDFAQPQKPADPLANLVAREGLSSKDVINWKIAIDSDNLEFNQSSLSELDNILFAIIHKKITNLSRQKNFELAWVKMPYAPEVFGTIDPKNNAEGSIPSSWQMKSFLNEFKDFGGKNPFPLYFPYDIHFTPSGNRLFAYLLANHLIESKKISGEPFNLNDSKITESIQKANGTLGEKIKSLPVWNLILAKKYKSLHQLKLAEKTLKLYLEKEPNSGDGLFQMGLIYYDLKQWDNALDYLNKAFKFNKIWAPEIINLMAKSYYRKGNLPNAEKLWRKAINLSPNDSRLYRNLGSLYFDNGYYEKAVNQYKISLELNPNEFKVYLVSGLAYLKLQDQAKAIEMFQNVLRIQPNNQLARGALLQLTQK